MELVASEPLIADPIAMQFDEQGRLIVVEMIDYSEQDRGESWPDRSIERSRFGWKDGLSGNDCGRDLMANCLGGHHARHLGSSSAVFDAPLSDDDGRWESEVLLEGFQRNNVQRHG